MRDWSYVLVGQFSVFCLNLRIFDSVISIFRIINVVVTTVNSSNNNFH